MRTQVTADQIRLHIVQAVALDQRSKGYMHEISGTIWIEHRTDLHNGANWELLMVPALTKLPPDCQAAILDAVSDLQTKYSLQATHFLGGSARA